MTAPLVRELERQNASRRSAAVRRSLDALAQADVRVVVTGQQVGLFLGPAYAFYKAATAIALARRLADAPVVPIFWLQSEDHDADEVAACDVLDEADEPRKVRLEVEGAARASLGERRLGEGVTRALDALAEALGHEPHVDEVMALLAAAYRPEATWVEAFAQAFGAIFDDAGLLLLDPRQDAVAALAAEVQRRAIVDAAALEEAVQVGAAALEARGRVPLVTPRPGCSLGFYHPDGPEGSRYRLVRDGERWRCPGRDGVWTTAALVEELAREPRRFSTSSLLRVVVQDSLLPTAAQVAGPSEAQYLEQMPPLHEAFGLRSPDVVLRGRFVVTDTAARRRLAALGLDATAVGGGPEAILERLASEEPGPNGDEVAARLVEAMGRELDALTPDLQAIDASLAHAVERTRRHVARGAGSLGRRIDRARARRDGVRNERVAWLCRRLAPGGIPQERGLSFVALAARYGIATLREAVAARVEDHLAISNEGRAPGLLEVAL